MRRGYFFNVKIVNAGTCEGKGNIRGTGWNHEEREAHEEGTATTKTWFGGTVQKTAVQ
jgi:hypothetical protein